MSGSHWPWTVLEIAPTDDRKTIREAYARLLKALDHEAETEAYMALRDARDAALSGEFLHPPGDEPEEDDYGLGTPLPDDIGADAAPGTEPPANPEPAEKPVFTVEYDEEDDRRFNRTVELFLGEGALTPGETEELHELLDHLLGDDRMADLGHYARIEAWLAQLLAERHPRGAALFPRVAEHFQWNARAHELGVHPAIPWLFNAHEGLSLVQELNTPGHAYHREWVELSRGKPQGTLWTRAIDKPRMANLIATIRRDYPWLEQEHWQPELVARWEKKVEGGGVSGPNPWVWIVLVAIFFAILPSLIESDGDTPPTTDEVLQRYANIDSPEIAIGAFLENRFPGSDVDVASLRRGNPDFLQEMTNVWDIYKMEPGPFESELVELTVETYFQSLRRLPDALLVEDAAYRRTVLDKLKTDPLRCAAFLRRPRSFVVQESRSADIPQDYLNHMLQVVQGKIPAPGAGPARSGAPVSVATLAAIAADSALPPSVLQRALAGPAASDVELCTAALALYSHLPKLPEAERRVLVTQMLRDRT